MVFLSMTLLALLVSAAVAEGPVVQIGVVIDSRWSVDVEKVRRSFEREVLLLTSGEFDVRFPEDKIIVSDATAVGIARDLERLLADPEVDLVVAGGLIASHLAGHLPSLPKPVVAPVVIDPAVQGIPLKGRVSGVKNLSYVTFPLDVKRDLAAFREVAKVQRLAMLYGATLAETVPELVALYLAQVRESGVEVVPVPVPVGSEAAAVLKALPEDVDGAFIALHLHIAPEQETALLQGLAERGLPSFTTLSGTQVERGLLMGLHPEGDIERLVRRAALTVQRILLGEQPGELPVVFSRRERLQINMATARTLGVYPSWALLTEAELVQTTRKEPARQLNLVAAVQEALRANVDLQRSAREVAAGREAVQQARAQLLPQIDLNGSGVLIDKERAGFLSQAEQSATGSASITQLVYAEGALANGSIQRDLQRGRRLEREQLRLDIVQAAATAYFNVLRSKTFEQVQQGNLELTRSNLELARLRQVIGASGPAEVYRWESQIATGRQQLIGANARRNVAEIALNRILHRPLEEAFALEWTDLHDPALVSHDPRFIPYMANPRNFKILRSFMVVDGLASSPELRQLDAAIAARARALKSAKRALWAPTVAVQGQVSNIFAEGGEGSGTPPPGALPIPVSGDDSHWNVGLNLSFPLYSGGAKFSARRQADAELAALELQRTAVAERIEQRIRSAMHLAGASYAGIGLARDASVAAHKNLDLVTDAYSRGTVKIIDLLDAQNAAVLAEEGAANATYDFLVDLMEVERSIGKFYLLGTEQERGQWFEQLAAFEREFVENE